jgi:hypothetical protein
VSRVKPRLLPWTTKAQLLLAAVTQERELAVIVDTETYSVLAVETPRLRIAGEPRDLAEAVFDNHAHQFVGQRESLADAIALAESYAGEWLERTTKGTLAAARCDCGEIRP